ncbi:D-alanyl-D-alanine carboxypeptidase family protein [Desulfurispira natronophila]|uniref:D-alanyl-D-alanine carboxypeptidase (Penicillin-binding protein 5/6) n=1 Tax=Desulfurispira natronophila TaxID=682562 RepID=A0A7W8DG29_9BACT|nr:D-alanyl-D-alanine carboxypeptidase family protein [Desulfurispira natronophila]MBB5020954.1 D-alanyl-D-alanine carboxypeptidase (penicillin-binding protein 5/6) [Desulfurispira natronophila]
MSAKHYEPSTPQTTNSKVLALIFAWVTSLSFSRMLLASFPLLFLTYLVISHYSLHAPETKGQHLQIQVPSPSSQQPFVMPDFIDNRQAFNFPESQHLQAVLVLDANRQEILYAKNLDQVRPIASLTKIFLMEEVFDRMQQGAFHPDTPVRASTEASLVRGSRVYLREHENTTVSQLAKATMIHSANDAAYQLGQLIAGGDADHAAQLLTSKAQALGLRNTILYNVNGLPNRGGADNVSTARELAQFTFMLMINNPELFELAATEVDYFNRPGTQDFLLVNRNRPLVRLDYVNGLKTGYTANAGFCVVTTSNKNNRKLITVILGAPSSQIRDRAAKRLIDHFSAHPRT